MTLPRIITLVPGLLARAKRVIAMRDADHLQEDGQRDVGVAWGLERENPRGRMV